MDYHNVSFMKPLRQAKQSGLKDVRFHKKIETLDEVDISFKYFAILIFVD